VKIAQQFGFTIGEIAELLGGLPNGRNPNKSDWARISARFRDRLDAKIETLTLLRDKLDGCIGCGCLSLDKCRLYNPDDQARRHGPGPRWLMGDALGE
jgi:MerR family redox-sensitive transcriptional activator SoxR